jgi:hypothetical protein
MQGHVDLQIAATVAAHDPPSYRFEGCLQLGRRSRRSGYSPLEVFHSSSICPFPEVWRSFIGCADGRIYQGSMECQFLRAASYLHWIVFPSMVWSADGPLRISKTATLRMGLSTTNGINNFSKFGIATLLWFEASGGDGKHRGLCRLRNKSISFAFYLRLPMHHFRHSYTHEVQDVYNNFEL